MPKSKQTKTPLSHSPLLLHASATIATIFLGFGLNALIRPGNALSFFNMEYPSPSATSSNKETERVITLLLTLYGIRDIFMALAIYISIWSSSGSHKITGGIMLAAAAVAVADGMTCWVFGTGAQGNHWGYAPMVAGVGGVLLGVFD